MSDQALESALPPVLTQADNLPSLPAVALEVLRLTQNDDTTIEELAEVIMRDPALSAKLLRLSNSAMFNPGGNEITGMHKAAMALGLKTVKLMSLSFSLVSSLPQGESDGALDLGLFWQRSLFAAVAGRNLAQRMGLAQADEAFTCGLLSRLGQLVMFQCMPEEYEPVLTEAGGELPSAELESKRLGFDHGVVAHALLRSWGLPPEIYAPVGGYVEPQRLELDDANSRQVCELVHLAELASRVLCDGEKGQALKRLAQTCAERGMGPEDVDEFLLNLQEGVAEAAEMLSVELPPQQDAVRMLDQARMQLVHISLDTTASLERAERRVHSLSEQNEELRTQATTDKLTGLGNRAFFDKVMQHEIERRMRENVPLCLGLLMIDVDHFKQFNDTHGHQTGDEVLAMVGEALEKYTRDTDHPARYGGEEFAVVAPQTTLDGLRVLAERIRFRIAQEQLLSPDGEPLSVTVSIGGACLTAPSDEGDAKRLVKVSDHFLYQAKKRGRNRCEFFPRTDLPQREEE